MLKRIFVFLIVFSSYTVGISQANDSSNCLLETEYFYFCNNQWINLHHFFFEQACHRQQQSLKSDSLEFLDIGDDIALAQLTDQERESYDNGVDFYSKHLIEKPLLNSGRLLKWLQSQQNSRVIADTTYSEAFTIILNHLSPIYKKYFWERHQKTNLELFHQYKEIIQVTEHDFIKKLEMLSGLNWEGKVRVDLTTYGNWASAYSPDFDNIVISSIDPEMHSSLYIEFIYHESSHLLFTRKSPFRHQLFLTAKELNIPYPRKLWHAAMFYLTGIGTKDILEKRGMSHELIMKRKKVFVDYYNKETFRLALDEYYKGQIALDTMAQQLLSLHKE